MSEVRKNRIRKQSNIYFTQVPNTLLNATEISLKAKGLYAFMLSKPDNWNFTIKSMAKQLKDGATSIANALRELKEFGWVEYTKFSDGSGEYYIFIEPKESNDSSTTREQKTKNNIKSETRFDAFLTLIGSIFSSRRLKTYSSKINKTKATREAFREAIDSGLDIEDIAHKFADYVERNKKMASRLDKFLIATIEGREQDLEYISASNKATNQQKMKPIAIEYGNGDYEAYDTGESLNWVVERYGIETLEARYCVVGAGKYLDEELKRRGGMR